MTVALRLAVAVMAMLVVGSAMVVAARYAVSAYRLGRAPGRILARHVVEVSTGASGLAAGYGIAVLAGLGGTELLSLNGRLVLYLISMGLLLVGVAEVAIYQNVRARSHPQRQDQVRDAIRVAIDRRRITGPRSADLAAVLAANAVLSLEGTPTLPEPDEPSQAEPDTKGSGTGRHALRKDRRTP